MRKPYFISVKNCWGFLAMLMSFLMAICLGVLPIPLWMQHLWPLWMALVLIFWAAYLPQVVSPWLVLFLGLLDDVLQGTVLGEHAFAFIVVYFLAHKMNRQVRGFSLLFQLLTIAIILAIYQGIIIIIQGIPFQYYLVFILPLLTSVILWPSLFFIMRSLAMRFYTQQI